MVAVFVAGAELQMAVKKEWKVVFEAREDEMLIVRVAGKNDFVGVDIVFGGGGDLSRLRPSGTQCAQHNETSHAQSACCGKLIREEIRTPENHSRHDQTQEHPRAYQASARH